MKLTDFIRIYENVISDKECDQIIQLAEKKGFQLYDEPGYKFLQVNLNQSGLSNLAQNFASVASYIAKDYFNRLQFSEFIDVQGFEEVRIKKYPIGSNYEFKTHIDAADKSSSLRYLVFILYLNDNNGHTVFDKLNFKYKPKKGSIIVLPPFWMFPHSGETPTDYDKYIMMTSLHFT